MYMEHTSIRKDTAEKLKRFAKLRLGFAASGLSYDDVIEWLLNCVDAENSDIKQITDFEPRSYYEWRAKE